MVYVMKKTIIYSALLITLATNAQDLTCADFKEGHFYVPADKETLLSYKIRRNGTQQIETVEDPDQLLGADFNKTAYQIIEWIDDCSYRLTSDASKIELSDYQKYINDANGLLVELIKIEGNCFYFKSTLNDQDIKQVINGKLCKE